MNGMMRTIGRLAAVGAVALLLAGSTAPTAEARVPMKAYWLMEDCEAAGGESYYFSFYDQWGVGCKKGKKVTVVTGGAE
jgi:hypothetical protein